MNETTDKHMKNAPQAISGSKECNKEIVVPITKKSRERTFNLLEMVAKTLSNKNA